MPVKTQPGYDTEQIENDLSALRGAHDSLGEYAEFTTVVAAGTVTAQQPGTTHSLAADGVPMTAETWHAFNPLSSSWLVPANGYADYRITPENELQIWAWIMSPAASVNNVTIATFPAGYRPQVTAGFAVAADAANNAAGAASPGMTITSAGVMQSQGIGASANVQFCVKIPLDTPV